MTKAQKDKYWMDCIQQCCVSGLSDHAWCHQNGISTSSFYYNIKRLRMKASDVPVPVSKVAAKQEVVPIHYNELPETKVVSPKNKQRLVPFGTELSEILYLYCVAMGILNNSEAYLFPENDLYTHISANSVGNYYRIIRKKAGINNLQQTDMD